MAKSLPGENLTVNQQLISYSLLLERFMRGVRKLLLVRRVRSGSMAPKLRPGQLVLATAAFRRLHPGQVVIVARNNKELIKRIERIEADKLFVVGDNLDSSVDSRQFGWLDINEVVARVLRPNLAK